MPRDTIAWGGSPGMPAIIGGDWTEAAFEVFTVQGLEAISIEALSKQLGATRGSFYWHFEARKDLIDSVLRKWKQGALQAQEQLQEIPDPLERLRTFLAEGIANPNFGKREINLLALMDDPQVRQSVEEHTLARINFVEEALLKAGHMPEKAHTEAIQSWALWIGAYQLATTMPDLVPGTTIQEKLAATTRRLLARIIEEPIEAEEAS